MGIEIIRAIGVCCAAGFLQACACETAFRQVFPIDGLPQQDCEFSLSECSPARTDFAVSAVMNHLRYHHVPSMASEYSMQAWTDIPWPDVPPMEYVFAGVDIGKAKRCAIHFSVKHASVYAELSMFLVSFSIDGEFKFAMYFNENTGCVGFSFQEAVASNLKFRGIPDYPYLSERELAMQIKFDKARLEAATPPAGVDGTSGGGLAPLNNSHIKPQKIGRSISEIMKHQPFDLEVDIDL